MNTTLSPDWIIEFETAEGTRYLNECLPGEPGRTDDLAKAERYATENEARENAWTVGRKHRQFRFNYRQLPR